jgi:hypothetical protein
MILRKFSLFVLFLFLALQSQAQDYKNAIGLKAGTPWISATFKTNLNEKAGIEVYAGFQSYGVLAYGFTYIAIGGLYQYHFPISSVEGLRWYVGGGAAASLYSYDDGWVLPDDEDGTFSFGPSICGGAEYKFAKLPLVVSVDAIPTLFFGGGYRDGFRYLGGAAARYTF